MVKLKWIILLWICNLNAWHVGMIISEIGSFKYCITIGLTVFRFNSFTETLIWLIYLIKILFHRYSKVRVRHRDNQ